MQEGLGNTHNQKQIGSGPSDYVFLLRRSTQVSPTFTLSVDYSSPHPSFFSPPTFPIFNKDVLYYTPAFIIPQDKAKFQKNFEVCLASHQRKVKEQQVQKEQIFQAKPSSSNSFCMVCKCTFEDYLAHIATRAHKKQVKKSNFCKDITSMCKKYNSKNTKQQKRKMIKKQKNNGKQSLQHSSKNKCIENYSTGQSQNSQPTLLLEAQK